MPTSNIPVNHTCQDGTHRFHAHLEPGLYRLTVDADAGAFDWESLYLVLNLYNNTNERTGPWDFNLLDNNRPLIPSYRLELNGRDLGVVYFNRPSAVNLDERRLLGEWGWWARQAGQYDLIFEPYNRCNIDWERIRLELDPLDRLERPAHARDDLITPLLPQTMPRNRFTELFESSVQYIKSTCGETNQSVAPLHIPTLAAAWRWNRDEQALQLAEAGVKHLLDLPAWGNPKEDGYGHNGDMGAARAMWGVAVAASWLADELKSSRSRMIDRLGAQGNIFLEQAILHVGYWGGSALQDHGFISTSTFAAAAYATQHLFPDVMNWLTWAIPRMRRTLRAMSIDGVAPLSSYHNPAMYVTKLVPLRELHRRATGEDLFDSPGCRNIARAARALYVPERSAFAQPSPRGDLVEFIGGEAFFCQFPRDPDAQWLIEQSLAPRTIPQVRDGRRATRFGVDRLWPVLLDSAGATPASPLPPGPMKQGDAGVAPAPTTVTWFDDSGVAALRGSESLVVVRCGDAISQSSIRYAPGHCDRINFAPMSGNFVYLHRGRLVLHTAEGGYRMYTGLGNVLLVDGRGQRGDRDIPMGHPGALWYGEKIEHVLSDDTGVRMNLAPAYELLSEYHRTIRLLPDGGMEILDEIRAGEPRALTWLLQTYQRNPWTRQSNPCWTLSVDGAAYRVSIEPTGCAVSTEVRPTKTVWAYVNDNNNQYCHHLHIDATQPLRQAVIRIRIQPTEQSE